MQGKGGERGRGGNEGIVQGRLGVGVMHFL